MKQGGSLIILLMCGFLAPLTIGGLNVMFVDRMWGLMLAVPVCVLAITQLMLDLVEVGELLLIVGVLLLPGVILSLIPKTSSMGLSYAMGILFILTSSAFRQHAVSSWRSGAYCDRLIMNRRIRHVVGHCALLVGFSPRGPVRFSGRCFDDWRVERAGLCIRA